MTTDDAIEDFGAEIVDRFGPLPEDVRELMAIVGIKALCHRANVEKIEAGPRGVIVAFRDNSFANPDGLIRYVAEQGSLAKVRPDMKIVFMGDHERPRDRLRASRSILRDLVAIAETPKNQHPKTKARIG